MTSTLKTIKLKTIYGEVTIANRGASIISMKVPDRKGELGNVILSYADINDYVNDPFYIGATVGRVAGRINKGEFKINEKRFFLTKNENSKNHLHGGFEGFNHKIFTMENIHQEEDFASVDLIYHSLDGEEGYPGNLNLKVNYTFKHNLLQINYEAESNTATPVNITNHCYFNLSGQPDKALEQQLFIDADKILETDHHYIPNGNRIDISNTSYDFNKLKSIGSQKGNLSNKGYNEYYIRNKDSEIAARLYDPISGRMLEINTSYPGILFYSGDYLSDKFNPCQGICLEAQYHPDAVNHSNFPKILLEAGKPYKHFIEFDFSVKE